MCNLSWWYFDNQCILLGYIYGNSKSILYFDNLWCITYIWHIYITYRFRLLLSIRISRDVPNSHWLVDEKRWVSSESPVTTGLFDDRWSHGLDPCHQVVSLGVLLSHGNPWLDDEWGYPHILETSNMYFTNENRDKTPNSHVFGGDRFLHFFNWNIFWYPARKVSRATVLPVWLHRWPWKTVLG